LQVYLASSTLARREGGDAMAVELCEECSRKMPYAVMYKENTPEWKYYETCVHGKDAAYEVMHEAKSQHPSFTDWRVFPKNVADAVIYGMKIGLEMAGHLKKPREKKKREKKRGTRPLQYMPDNM
jgi:hypothetical protein